MSDSLINPEDGQPLLPATVGDGDVFCERMLEHEGEFTGDRLFAQKPEIYRGVVALLARGWGAQRIADVLKVSKNTVKAVRTREGQTIEDVKARLSGEGFDLAGDALEAAKMIVEEVMSDPFKRRKLTVKDAKDLAIVAGVAVQNGQLLSGAPTSRVEVHELQTPEHDAFNAYINGLQKLAPAIDPAKVIDLAPDPAGAAAMGCRGETLGQKEGASDGGAGTGDATDGTAGSGAPGTGPE